MRLALGTVQIMDIRPLQLGTDLDSVSELIQEVEAVDGHPPIGEHKYLALTHGRPDDLVGLVGYADERLIAYVALTAGREEGWWAMELALHPRHRNPKNFVALFEAGTEEVVRRGGNAIRAWIFQPRLAEAAVRAGFEAERELHKLERSLPLGLQTSYPAFVFTRPFRVGSDEEDWLAVNNAAFADHPENGHWTRELIADRMSRPWFDAHDLVMAWDASSDPESLAGFCWIKREIAGEGEIYVIAVDPAYQGRGIGRALVVDGIGRMESAGDRLVFLYTDANNTAGLTLYRSLGFYLDHVDRSFVRVL